MEHCFFNNDAVQPVPFSKIFDGNKMKGLLVSESKENENFSERFSKWVKQYTKAAKEKIWMDIEYYRSK